jgi:hypothetical protein
MGREGEDSQWLLGQGGPESMASPQQGPPRNGEGVFYRRKKQMGAWRNFIVRLLFFALLVSVFSWFLVGILRAVGGNDRRHKVHHLHEQREAAIGWKGGRIDKPNTG